MPPLPDGDKPKVASEEDPLNSSEFSKSKEPDDTVEVPSTPSKKRRLFPKLNLHNAIGFRHWKQLSKNQKIASLVILGLLLIGGTLGAMELFIKDPPEPSSPIIQSEKPAPTTAPSPLTGIEVSIDLSQLPVTGVIIENSPEARPQAGLQESGVVFEAIAEGGITRFLVLFQEAKPAHIGPVRSVRPYYLDWLLSFDAAIAHAGGSAEALAKIKSVGVKDIDHGANGATFQRVSNRYAPHNLYTSRDKLLAVHTARGYTTSSFKGFERKKKEEPAEAPTAGVINMNISSTNYNSVFNYDKGSNSYLRSMAGKPHVDEKSGKQINPKVVVALVTDRSQSGIYSVYRTTGTGTALIFQDGGVIQAAWRKADIKSELAFSDASGKAIALNPGQTWITVLANVGQASYGP